MNTNEKNCTVKPALVTTSIEQQLYFLFAFFFILNLGGIPVS
jgi:hypothetical protein